jgi:hypothetical protein
MPLRPEQAVSFDGGDESEIRGAGAGRRGTGQLLVLGTHCATQSCGMHKYRLDLGVSGSHPPIQRTQHGAATRMLPDQ